MEGRSDVYAFHYNLMVVVVVAVVAAAVAAPNIHLNTEQKLKLILLPVLIEKYKIHMLFDMERRQPRTDPDVVLSPVAACCESMAGVPECICVMCVQA